MGSHDWEVRVGRVLRGAYAARFGSDGKGPAAAARELKQLVKALHAAGIEVLLDVVYNHTVEGAHACFLLPLYHPFPFSVM